MTFADLFKDIIDSSKDRVKTPISGSYVLAFVLWNWRPIALLIFEETSITQKIIVINKEYCNVWAILGPLLLGLLFTLGIPYLMALIDLILRPAKKMRLKSVYNSKTDDINEQIELVVKELALQDKRNRSKTTEDFEKQISELQNRIDTNIESHKSIVEGYEHNIKNLNQVIQQANDRKLKEQEILEEDERETKKVLNFLSQSYSLSDFEFMKETPADSKNTYSINLLSSKVKKDFLNQDLIAVTPNGFFYTRKGRNVVNHFRKVLEPNLKSPNSFLHPDVD